MLDQPHNMTADKIQPSRPRILVVDDVETNRQVVCRRLENSIFDVLAVDSGEKALRIIEEERPDLVLLDYMMPQMNGIEVLNVVRKDWKIDDLPIIMLTARAEADAIVDALDAGADDYISKPIDFDVLEARIEKQLGKFKSKNSLLQANAALDERVAMRVLAFDQLRDELEREISLRKRAEHELETLRQAAHSSSPLTTSENYDEALQIVRYLIDAASTGNSINKAMLLSLQSKLENMRYTQAR